MQISQPIQLYVELCETPSDETPEPCAWLRGADALVLDPARCTPRQFEPLPVERAILLNGDPQRHQPWRELSGEWVCDRGIEATARLRDLHPRLHWIPRLEVLRARVSYRFSGPAVGEGFSFYMPDTAAIKGWRVEDMSLEAALERLAALGFDDLWLHSPGAQSRRRGLDLDLLDKTRHGDQAVWLSGGVDNLAHLRNLAREGGASAVIVDASVAQECSLVALAEALGTEPPRPQAVAVEFEPQKADPGAG